VVEQTDEGQEMEITPLLTSVENGGPRDMILEKYFWGGGTVLGCGRSGNSPPITICSFLGLSGHVFGKIFLGEALLWNLEPVAPIPEEL
jgi:hypothetical protein